MSELSTEKSWRVSWSDTAYWQAVRTEVLRDRLIYGIILLHAFAALVLALIVKRPDKLVYFQYAGVWLRALVTVAMIYLTITELPGSIRANPSRPLARFFQRVPQLLTPRVAAACVLVVGIILFKGSFTSVKSMLADVTPFLWDVPLAAIDAWLHGGQDPWRWLQPVLGHHVVTRVIQFSYTGLWMVGVCTLPAFIAASRRLDHLRLRFLLTYLFCWIFLGNVMAGLFMSAGPVYFGHVTGDVVRFADQMAYLSFSDGLAHSSYELQGMLWRLHTLGRMDLGSGISAFPSLHVAMATLFALAGWSINRWAGIAGTVFLVVIMAGSVHLAWHYAIDGYASMIAVAGVWFAIGAWQRRGAGFRH